MLKKKRHGRAYMRTMFGIAIVMLASLLVLALVGSYWVTDSVTNYAVQTYQKNLDGIVQVFDREIQHMSDIAAQLSGTNWVRRIMHMQGDSIDRTRVNGFDLSEYKQQLQTLWRANPLISDIGILFFDKDLIISSFGNVTWSFMAQFAVDVEGMSLEDWQALQQSLANGAPHIISDAAIQKYGALSRSMLIAYPLQDGSSSEVRAAMFAVIHHASIEQFLAPLIFTDEQTHYSLSLAAGGDPFIEIGEKPQAHSRILRSASGQTGWTFTIEMPESIVLQEAMRTRDALLKVVLGLGALILLAALLITHRFFEPLVRLVRLVDGTMDERLVLDEYASIRQGIENLYAQRAVLKGELQARQPIAFAAAFHLLLAEETPDSGALDKLTAVLHIDPHWGCYVACEALPMADARPEQAASQMATIDRVVESLTQPCYVVSSKLYGAPALLLCAPNRAALEGLLVQILEALPALCLVLGEIVSEISELPRALKTVLIARDYRLVSKGFRVLRYDEALLNKGGYYLPQYAENQLNQAIYSGNEALAMDQFDKLYDHNRSQTDSTYMSVRNFLFNIYLNSIRLTQGRDEADVAVAAWHEDPPIEQLLERVRDAIRQACDWNRARIQNTPARLEAVLDYIEDNLADSGLSLGAVAAAFGVSTSQISRLFADGHDDTFLAHVNRRRMERAADLLRCEPQMDIQQIAKAVGYDHDTTFRRLFKKHMGMAPSAYRDQP